MESKLLIIGTVPYNNQSPSRAFNSYFYGWNSKNLAQIFSNPSAPKKGHCGTLYQITDVMMLKKFFNHDIKIGNIFYLDELDDNIDEMSTVKQNKLFNLLHMLGARKSSIAYLLRGMIWKKKYWCSDSLIQWIENFNPNCIFLAFSDDFFILKIALFIAEKYNIPIVSCIGDDYYFNYKFSISPFYHIYKLAYRKLVRKVFARHGSAIYISNKIRDKYNSEFGLNGETVYLTSDIKRREFKAVNKENPIISYFGNIRLGRNESLSEIATVLGEINPDFVINVYSGESDKKYTQILQDNSHVVLHNAINYSEVMRKTAESDIILVTEGFKKKDVNISRYSLSTKVADALASGANVFAYGSIECGAIEYAIETKCITTCINKGDLKKSLEELINNPEFQKKCYDRAIEITEENHRLEQSTKIFKKVVEREIKGN